MQQQADMLLLLLGGARRPITRVCHRDDRRTKLCRSQGYAPASRVNQSSSPHGVNKDVLP